MKITEEQWQKAAALRRKLHEIPEQSMQEKQTKACLMEFLRVETDLQLVDHGTWFYAVWEGAPGEAAIAFRADMDAVQGADGSCHHVCGHDGHSANLALFALWLNENRPKKTVLLLFQPGEENGAGGALCREIFAEREIAMIYGFHNIPGAPLGEVLLRDGTFACASTGLAIHVVGAPTHAAYPEAGINPAGAIAALLIEVDRYLQQPHRGVLLSTVIGIDLGSSSYGVAAAKGTLRLTLRGEFHEEFLSLLTFVKDRAKALAQRDGLRIEMQEIEMFPATENDLEAVQNLREAAERANCPVRMLAEPFRWSEDFGWYLQRHRGAFFGVGAGEDCPQLHTAEYEFRDSVMQTAVRVFVALCEA